MSEDMAWLFLVCGLMGSIIALIEHAGGSFAFGDWVSRRAKTRESSILWTAWVLGMAIFIDDYLNSLTVGSSMAPVTDRHKVSREMLAYVVDSTADARMRVDPDLDLACVRRAAVRIDTASPRRAKVSSIS